MEDQKDFKNISLKALGSSKLLSLEQHQELEEEEKKKWKTVKHRRGRGASYHPQRSRSGARGQRSNRGHAVTLYADASLCSSAGMTDVLAICITYSFVHYTSNKWIINSSFTILTKNLVDVLHVVNANRDLWPCCNEHSVYSCFEFCKHLTSSEAFIWVPINNILLYNLLRVDNSFVNWSLRTLLSNLFEAVRGNSGTILTELTCLWRKRKFIELNNIY